MKGQGEMKRVQQLVQQLILPVQPQCHHPQDRFVHHCCCQVPFFSRLRRLRDYPGLFCPHCHPENR